MVVDNIGRRQQELGRDAVQLARVKAQVSIYGGPARKRGDRSGRPKKTTSHRGRFEADMEEIKAGRETGIGRVIKWNQKARVNYLCPL